MKKSTFAAVLMLVVILFGLWPVAQTASAATKCDWVQFVADVTVPDGSAFKAGDSFNKTWKLKNIGTCTWSTDYSLVFVSGAQMSAPASIKLPNSVAPGQTISLTVSMTAPNAAGTHQGNWQLKNAGGVLFGIGANADKAFWVQIKVGGSSGSTGYDFAANAASAAWKSGAGDLTFGAEDAAKGFAKKLDAPKLENGTTDSLPGLLLVPQNVTDGYIQGTFPVYKVGQGDRFQTTVNCEYGATSCWVNFRLQYQIGSGAVQTLWSFNEKYEGGIYRANIDLSKLAGQEVKFILRNNAAGSASGDRALWGSPIIVSGGGTTPTKTPTVTGTPPTPTSTPVPGACTDRILFVADASVPDGTAFAANTNFTKKWRIKNVGTCTFTTNYSLVYVSGDKMGNTDTVKFKSTIAPNTTFEIEVGLTSPGTNGSYRGYWQLKNDKGDLFGIGASYNKPFWVDIKVQGGLTPVPTTPVPTTPSPVGTVLDFAADASKAAWKSGSGDLTFPGADGDAKGFAIKLDSVKMETGNTDNRAALLTFPQNVTDGYIQGTYPAFKIQSGDRFQATIGCQHGSTGCYITYRLDYQIGSGAVQTLWTFREKNEGMVYNVNLDLSKLAGQEVKFILKVMATGTAANDRAIWVNPRITRAGGAATSIPPTATPVTPSVTPTPTGTPSAALTNGLAYANPFFGYSFKYPRDAQLEETPPDAVRFNLTFKPGTNLVEKWMDVTGIQVDNTAYCAVNDSGEMLSKNETINGITFLHQEGGDAGAGQIYLWVAYSTVRETTCVTFKLVLHSSNPDMYATKPPLYDETAEKAIIADMVATFAWLQPYGVYNVAGNDTLNVRSGAGVSHPVATTLPYDMPNVFRTGNKQTVDSAEWWEIYRQGGGVGWVNSNYLTERRSASNACTDARIGTLLVSFDNAVSTANGAALANLVSPKHGLEVRFTTSSTPAGLSKEAVTGIFTSTTAYNWGIAPGSGAPVLGTFKDKILPKLLDVLSADYQTACNDASKATAVSQPWPAEYANLNFYALYKSGTPGTELDWRYWLVGIEYVNGQPYIAALVQIQWEP